jgi:ubiquitin-conjugating enzyme (huntingtin interacting protein 2)
MDARLRRVNKEIAGRLAIIAHHPPPPVHFLLMFAQDCKNDKTSNINITLIDDSPFHLKGSFPGPEGTPYEGGQFDVVRSLLTDYHQLRY